jgi:hypothetical protein
VPIFIGRGAPFCHHSEQNCELYVYKDAINIGELPSGSP